MGDAHSHLIHMLKHRMPIGQCLGDIWIKASKHIRVWKRILIRSFTMLSHAVYIWQSKQWPGIRVDRSCLWQVKRKEIQHTSAEWPSFNNLSGAVVDRFNHKHMRFCAPPPLSPTSSPPTAAMFSPFFQFIELQLTYHHNCCKSTGRHDTWQIFSA